jgi:hypothetical protein
VQNKGGKILPVSPKPTNTAAKKIDSVPTCQLQITSKGSIITLEANRLKRTSKQPLYKNNYVRSIGTYNTTRGQITAVKNTLNHSREADCS